MKKYTLPFLITTLGCSFFAEAGPYVEAREAFNSASEHNEVVLRGGYNFTNGAGIMFTNAYDADKLDQLKHSYNETEGWYPLFKPTTEFTISPGGLVNSSSSGSGVSGYMDFNYKFTPVFNVSMRYRYNHSNYETNDLDGNKDYNDTHQLIMYWNYKISDTWAYTFEPDYYIRVNNYESKNGKDHSWELNNKIKYTIDQHWQPYLEASWLDRWNAYSREQVRIRVGVRYSF